MVDVGSLAKGLFFHQEERSRMLRLHECKRRLTLKVPITAAADDKFCDLFPSFRKNKVCYCLRIVCTNVPYDKHGSNLILRFGCLFWL